MMVDYLRFLRFFIYTPRRWWPVAIIVSCYWLFTAMIPSYEIYQSMVKDIQRADPGQEVVDFWVYEHESLFGVSYAYMIPFAAIWWIFILCGYPGRVHLLCWNRQRPVWSILWTGILVLFMGLNLISFYYNAFIDHLGRIALSDAGGFLLCMIARASLVAKSKLAFWDYLEGSSQQ